MATQNAGKKQRAYLKQRAEYRARQITGDLVIEDQWYAVKAKGLLNGRKLGAGLEIKIPKWDTPPPGIPGVADMLQAQIDKGEVFFVNVGLPVPCSVPPGQIDFPPGMFPLTWTISNNDLPRNATCRLRYTVLAYNNEDPDPSPVTTVIVDQVSPNEGVSPAALIFPTTNLDDTILPPGGQIRVQIPGYKDWQATDKLAVYMVDANNIPADPGAEVPIFTGLAPGPGVTNSNVDLDADKIRAFGDAKVVFLYLLTDEATNISDISYYTTATLLVGGLPAPTALPRVPQADPVVHASDAINGVSVWIDVYPNAKAGDLIHVEWGAEQLTDFIVTNPIPAQEFEIPVTPPVLMLRDYGPTNVGEKDTTVKYHVSRQGRMFGPLEATIKVDFGYVIPWVPFPPIDWPDPTHPELLEGEVKNHDGTRTNQLTRADKDEDAVLHFKWYDSVANLHVVKFYWGGLEMPEAQLTFDDTKPGHTPGADFTTPVLWKYIQQAGNAPIVPVYFEASGPNVANPVRSDIIEVDVNAISLELPEPDFPTFAGQPLPTHPGCGALEPDGSLKFRIPDLTGLLKDGDQIVITFTPMKGQDLSQPDDPISAAIFTKTVTLGTPGAPLTGFDDFVTPYATHIKPLYDENAATGRRGRVKLEYTFNDGTENIASVPRRNVTAFHRTSGECAITPSP